MCSTDTRTVKCSGHRNLIAAATAAATTTNLPTLYIGVGTPTLGNLCGIKTSTLMQKVWRKGKPAKTAGISIFCDGSRINSQTGCGYVIQKGEEILEMRAINLDSRNSVYQAEVCAIKSAIDTLGRMEGGTDVTLYSDSQSALVSLRKFFVQSKLLKACINSLNTVGRDRKVTLRWVKAHVGHPGNELADELARTGAKLGDELKVDDIRINCPHSYIKEIIKKGFIQKWNLKWSLLRECRQTKIWFPGISPSKSADILCCSRENLSWLVQLITGHNRMKRHESLIDTSLSPTCRKCQEDVESSLHVYAECPALAWHRRMATGELFVQQPLTWSVKQVFRFISEPSIKCLLDQHDGEE